jgi:3-hydroxypropionyl-coenzyme A dehydratase
MWVPRSPGLIPAIRRGALYTRYGRIPYPWAESFKPAWSWSRRPFDDEPEGPNRPRAPVIWQPRLESGPAIRQSWEWDFPLPTLTYETLRYDVAANGVATITLDQPETRNALSPDLLVELVRAFEEAREEERVRCVVLTSSHEKVFSSGANIAAFAGDTPLVHRHFGTELFVRLFGLIGRLGKPSICAANGHVLAGSLGIALACDLIIAKDGAGFGTPEINVGLFPFMIMALIYRNVPRKTANEMLLLGERMTAQEALEAGIVNRVVPAGEFDAVVADCAAKLASKSPIVMKLGKDAMFRQQDMALQDALEFLQAQLTIELSTDDAVEGVKAFFEKREPQWTGR